MRMAIDLGLHRKIAGRFSSRSAAVTLGDGMPSRGTSSCFALSAKGTPRQNGRLFKATISGSGQNLRVQG
jgi:hypothetical protein